MVGSGTGARVVGLDGNDDVVVVVVDAPAAATVVVLVGVATALDVVVFVPTNADPPPLLKAGAVNFNPSIKAGTTATAFDLYNFEWN